MVLTCQKKTYKSNYEIKEMDGVETIMKISNEAIEHLVFIINDLLNRNGSKLVDYFNQLGFNHNYPESVQEAGSKAKYTRSVLESVNGSARLDEIVMQVIHPRQYLNSGVVITELIDNLNKFLTYDGLEIIPSGNSYTIKYNKKQNSGFVKNLIFASDGPKPVIILKDTLTYEIEVVKNKKSVLIYDETITSDGLTWNDLKSWWINYPQNNISLHKRLRNSLDPNAEDFFYKTYYSHFNTHIFTDVPALIPQVYLHYDPYTLKQLSNGSRIPRQRMDFLLLLPQNEKIIIEIDGKHHYSRNNNTSPCPIKYAEMVSEDRKLRLKGYEVYRFGGYELMFNNPYEEAIAKKIIVDFFEELFKKHQINLTPIPSKTTP
jgi:very-short-patch-repair endonuclease